MNEKYKAEV